MQALLKLPQQRPSAKELLSHPWLTAYATCTKVPTPAVGPATPRQTTETPCAKKCLSADPNQTRTHSFLEQAASECLPSEELLHLSTVQPSTGLLQIAQQPVYSHVSMQMACPTLQIDGKSPRTKCNTSGVISSIACDEKLTTQQQQQQQHDQAPREHQRRVRLQLPCPALNGFGSQLHASTCSDASNSSIQVGCELAQVDAVADWAIQACSVPQQQQQQQEGATSRQHAAGFDAHRVSAAGTSRSRHCLHFMCHCLAWHAVAATTAQSCIACSFCMCMLDTMFLKG